MPTRDQTHPPADPEMAELAEYFTRELPARVRSLQDAAAAGRLEALQTLAHQLKGAAPGFGFPGIGEAAKALEMGLKNADPQQRSIDRVRAELDALIGLCRSHARMG